MNLGSVAEWVLLLSAFFVFVVSNVVAYAIMKRDFKVVRENQKSGTEKHEALEKSMRELGGENSDLKKEVHRLENRIESLGKDCVSATVFDSRISSCRNELTTMINGTTQEMEQLKVDLKEIKDIGKAQAEQSTKIAIAIAELSTKLDERAKFTEAMQRMFAEQNHGSMEAV